MAQSTDDEKGLAEGYLSELHQAVSALNPEHFRVKAKLRSVVEFSDKARWQRLGKSDMLDINTELSALIPPNKDENEFAKRFDVLILNYQLALLTRAYSGTDHFITKIVNSASELLKKQNLPEVAAQVPLLKELQAEVFWQAMNVNRLDEVRLALRDLMKFLDKEKQVIIETTFEDTLQRDGVKEQDLIPAFGRLQSYKDRVASYVREHKDHLVIQKLKSNQPITETDIQTLEDILFDGVTVGTKQDYIEHFGDQPLGEFIRSIVGLDVAVAQALFSEFIQAGNLRADQMTFINQIITYLTKNGVIDKAMLFEPPFTDVRVFDDADVSKVIQLIDQVNANAVLEIRKAG